MTYNHKMLVANWKLNHDKKTTLEFIKAVLEKHTPQTDLELVIAPVCTLLDRAYQAMANSFLKLSAQNVFYEQKGAFTGEYSAAHIAEVGCKFCIVGHSERRRLFYETDEQVYKKALACYESGVTPICCVGETLMEKESGVGKKIILNQVSAIISKLPKDKEYVFAYEPVWAIGTGVSANKKEIEETHRFIRDLVGKKCRILYGGSVSIENISEIVSIPGVDGVLVGGASLQVDSFLSMVRALEGMEKQKC